MAAVPVSARSRDEQLRVAVERVHEEVERREDELIATIGDLVRLPSPLGLEAPAQTYVAEHLRASGARVDVWESDESLKQLPGAGDPGVLFAGRPNVAGVFAGAGGGRSLILQGHIDVVSAEPVEDWSYDPWQATIVGDRMYGRGAYDMKCGIAGNMLLPRILCDLGIELRGDLIVQSVIEEECSGNGALDASRRYQADAALVAESMNGDFVFAHVGVMWFKIEIAGKTSHAARALEGVNAISKAVPVIQALEALDRRLNEERHPAFAAIPHPVGVNIGMIAGGDWPSTLAGRCELRCRMGVYPGHTIEEMRGEIDTALRLAAADDDWLSERPPVVTYYGHQSPGSIVALDEPFVQTLGEWHARVTGRPLRYRADTGTLDMRYYNFAGMPSGCYGAAGANPHAADEWLDLRSLVPTVQVLAGFVLDWCGIAGIPDAARGG